MVHCTLPPGGVTQAVRHRTVEELWYCLEGAGEVWRKQRDQEEVTRFEPGVSLSITVGTHFQFRAVGGAPLRFVIVTMPPWPGEHEAEVVENYW
jgi:mannose-6-phosphate isomerase-like protein (cupin superfamily)